ncbi:MAG: beta-galactosidase [Firmicutes bacterium]|nr:beta-galactosidase [Bacillota bacterium]
MNIQFGVDYYPEHWPRERWETDAAMMEEMGIRVVRMAEFSWFKLEPEKGRFTFEWLDEAIRILAAHGIETILGTPSAAPPAWIIRQDPDIQPVDREGRRRHFGGRHHDCQSNPAYREHIRRYVTAFAAHFGPNPHVIGWQIDNELGNSHAELCFCESCAERFREWLRAKYSDIETLNRRWGTDFWSQGYTCFEEIQPPRLTATGVNPSQMLDWKRFHSDLIVEFHRFQSRILHAAAPGKFITHNMMGLADTVNYYDLAEDLEFVSQDQYPVMQKTTELPRYLGSRGAAALDLIRGLKQQSFWIMEQQSSISGWGEMSRMPRPGEVKLWALQSVARGADTVVFFRWRSCLFGTEQYWHGILPHSGRPGRTWAEIRDLMQQYAPLVESLRGGMPVSEAAIVYSYDQKYAMQIQPHHPDLKYDEIWLAYYMALYRKNVPTDIIPDRADFSRYKLLIAPLQYLMTPELARKYEEYVQGGGTLVFTMRTGVKDRDNICTEEPLPGLLAELCGLHVYEYDCLRGMSAEVRWGEDIYTTELWADLITPEGAETVAAYASEYYAGVPAITCRRCGKGRVYYVGTAVSADLADRLCTELLEASGAGSILDTPEGVEAVCRQGRDGTYYFLLNHTERPQNVEVPASWKPWGEHAPMPIPPFGVNVYRTDDLFAKIT